MTAARKILSMAVILLLVPSSGCWNYREIDKLSVVAGVAIDRGKNELFEITVEIIQIKAGKESNVKSNILTAEGKSLFDAARNIISVSGKRLYWSHTKVIIISKYIAQEGVNRALEWYNRDAETRENVRVLISQCETAKEIFTDQQSQEEILSFSLDQILENEASLGKATVTDILSYDIQAKTEGVAPVVAAIGLIEKDGKQIPQIMGTAFIKDDRIAGFLDGEETLYLNFLRNEIKSCVLVEDMRVGEQNSSVTLEVFSSKTRATPIVEETGVKMLLKIKTITAIGEINGGGDFINGEGLEQLTQKARASLKTNTEMLIAKMQTQYNADVFGFAAKLREDNPGAFECSRHDWDDTFRNMKVAVDTDIIIRNSAIFAKPVAEEE